MYLALLIYRIMPMDEESDSNIISGTGWHGQQFAVMVEMFQPVSRYQPGSPCPKA
jgi:hypothetical protein